MEQHFDREPTTDHTDARASSNVNPTVNDGKNAEPNLEDSNLHTTGLNSRADLVGGELTEGEKLSENLNEELNIDQYISKPCETVNPSVEDTSDRVNAESENIELAKDVIITEKI